MLENGRVRFLFQLAQNGTYRFDFDEVVALPKRPKGSSIQNQLEWTDKPKSGAEGARTPDLLAASQTLSQLSYSPSFL